MKGIHTLFIFFILPYALLASEVVTITSSMQEHHVSFGYIDVWEDTSGKYTIEQISAPEMVGNFKTNTSQLPRNEHTSSVYWLRFSILDHDTSGALWLLEYYDSSIEHIHFYIPDSLGKYTADTSGSRLPFGHKKLSHKNFEFLLPDLPHHTPVTFYARIQSSRKVFMYAVVRKINRFVYYALNEYYFLGIFYGIIIAMAIYNLLLFFTVKDRTNLYYVLYVVSSAFLCTVMDGTGFQHFWPNHPDFNYHAYALASFAMSITALLYTQGFVEIRKYSRLHFNILELFIVVRLLIFIAGRTLFPSLMEYLVIDGVVLLVCFASGIYSFRSGNKSTRYFVIGFACFFIGYLISNLTVNSIFGFSLPNNIWTVYSLNFGIVLEMVFLSYALADRMRMVMDEAHLANLQVIEELQKNDELKLKVNKELEQKVTERTVELQQTNDKLSTMYAEMERLYHEVTDNIKVAHWIQMSILPPLNLMQSHLKQCFVLFKPKDVVSGDFYWFEYQHGKCYIAAVDCTGHGVSGAFMSFIGYNILNNIVRSTKNKKLNAGQILDKLNDEVVASLLQRQEYTMSRDGMDINLCIIDFDTYTLQYAGAVNYLYLVRQGELIKFEANTQSIGTSTANDPFSFKNYEIPLVKGDMIIQYTDGYADQLGGPTGMQKFKYPKFRDMVVQSAELAVDEQYKIFKDNIENWMGQTEQTDDILVVGIKIE